MAIESTFDGRNRRGDIKMTPHEIEEFFATGPDVMTLATVNGDGSIHLATVAFAFIGGVIWAKSKARAQKVINIRLHPFASCMMSDGDDAYKTMRAACLPEAR